jgi:hypothetical protein
MFRYRNGMRLWLLQRCGNGIAAFRGHGHLRPVGRRSAGRPHTLAVDTTRNSHRTSTPWCLGETYHLADAVAHDSAERTCRCDGFC